MIIETRSCSRCEQEFEARRKEGARREPRWYYCPDCRRKIQAKYTKAYRKKLRLRVLKYIAGDPPRCAKCGLDDDRILQIDHIAGGGYKDPLRASSANKYYLGILKLTEKEIKEKYQILCPNCNWIKKVELEENPNKER